MEHSTLSIGTFVEIRQPLQVGDLFISQMSHEIRLAVGSWPTAKQKDQQLPRGWNSWWFQGCFEVPMQSDDDDEDEDDDDDDEDEDEEEHSLSH